MEKMVAAHAQRRGERRGRLFTGLIAGIFLLVGGCSGGGSSGPTVTLSASPNPVNPPPDPGATTLSWSSANVTACSASDGWTGSKPTSGFENISGITSSQKFLLTCTGSNGSASASVTVTINLPPVANNSCSSIQDGDTSVGVTLPGNDPNGNNTIDFYTIFKPDNGRIMECDPTYPCTRSSPSVTYLPNIASNLRGIDKFTFQVTDSGSLSSSVGTVTILNNGSVRIMPLGDSITAGVSGSITPDEYIGYRRQLFQALENASPNYGVNFVGSITTDGATAWPDTDVPVDRDHEGHPGMCAADTDPNADPICDPSQFGNLLNSITGFLNANPPDIVLLHIGTNDFKHTQVTDYENILNAIDSWESANYPVTVMLARIIPAQNGALDVQTLNNAVEAMVPTWLTNHPKNNVFVVNQQAEIALVGFPDTADATLMGDNLHPNSTGYGKMADRWKADLITHGVLPSCP